MPASCRIPAPHERYGGGPVPPGRRYLTLTVQNIPVRIGLVVLWLVAPGTITTVRLTAIQDPQTADLPKLASTESGRAVEPAPPVAPDVISRDAGGHATLRAVR